MSQMRKLHIQPDFSKKNLGRHHEEDNFQESDDFKEENMLSYIEEDASEDPLEFLRKDNIAKFSSHGKLTWTNKMVKLLLSVFKELEPKVGKCIPLANKTKMWIEITKRFKEHGYIVSSKQLKNKYSGLERNYKRMLALNRKTGNNKFTCPFKSELIENKPAIVPEYTLGTEGSQSMEGSSSTDETMASEIDELLCNTPERKLRPEPTRKRNTAAIKLQKLHAMDESTAYRIDENTTSEIDEPLCIIGTPEEKLHPEPARKLNSVAIELRKLRGIDESTAYRIDENATSEIDETLCSTPESKLHPELARNRNSVAVELRKLCEIKSAQWKLLNEAKDQYYKQKLEILRRKEQRMELYLKRKEEHMAKKEKYWTNCRR